MPNSECVTLFVCPDCGGRSTSSQNRGLNCMIGRGSTIGGITQSPHRRPEPVTYIPLDAVREKALERAAELEAQVEMLKHGDSTDVEMSVWKANRVDELRQFANSLTGGKS